MPRALLTLALCLLPSFLLADSLDGHYLTTLDGQPAEMHLRSQGKQVTGEYVEGGRLRLQISGSFDGQLLSAQISEAQSGQLIANMNATYANGMLNAHIAARNPTTGATLERKALFHRQSLSAVAAQASSPSSSATRDPALIGTWVHEKIINSGGANFASMTTQMILQLQGDGSVSQWTRSVAGGADWNYNSPGELQYSGRWQSNNGLLEVQMQGRSDYQPAAYYRFSDQYLVTESNTGKLIWQRRQ
ncbi:conserved exported hypothetical protein [Pseudomonas sp. 8BK]|uniref:hypothetical protein n=1 Tax=Pseudomonas sp. 8BK TaxID=2653164 RepID=UPI0012F203C0|nr:hypothetical protein [Pseudomonas sp. 8BK]VXB07405.1 conserved exported hypothetical protein [Pseudomonas sp. 8BK]